MNWLEYAPIAIWLLPITWLFVRQNKMADKLDSTYTKSETEHVIGLLNKPIEVALNRNTETQKELATAIKELQKELHNMMRN